MIGEFHLADKHLPEQLDSEISYTEFLPILSTITFLQVRIIWSLQPITSN